MNIWLKLPIFETCSETDRHLRIEPPIGRRQWIAELTLVHQRTNGADTRYFDNARPDCWAGHNKHALFGWCSIVVCCVCVALFCLFVKSTPKKGVIAAGPLMSMYIFYWRATCPMLTFGPCCSSKVQCWDSLNSLGPCWTTLNRCFCVFWWFS